MIVMWVDKRLFL